MNKLNLIALPLTLLSSAAFATSTQVYIEQNVASNAADNGIYTTEAGALIDTSENGQVYIGFDDQVGWLRVTGTISTLASPSHSTYTERSANGTTVKSY